MVKSFGSLTEDRPDVVAAISDVTHTVDQATAAGYRHRVEGLDFLCGYRAECVWEGDAIRYLEEQSGGLGEFRHAAFGGARRRR